MTINRQTFMMIPVICIYPIWFYSFKAQCNYWHIPGALDFNVDSISKWYYPFG